MKNHKAVHHRSPEHTRPPVQHETNVTRAYRLGKSETLYEFVRLLINEHYSTKELKKEIVGRMHDLFTSERTELLGAQHAQKFQESQGLADACICSFDLVATRKLSGEALAGCIADRLAAIWPPDYFQYRQRYMATYEKDPNLPKKFGFLDLRSWYDAVDDLQFEIEWSEATGLPPSEAQAEFAAQLLCFPGDRTPSAE